MEKCGNPVGRFTACATAGVSACSACAGDYEDPDRTAPGDEGGAEAEEEWHGGIGAEGFLRGEIALQE